MNYTIETLALLGKTSVLVLKWLNYNLLKNDVCAEKKIYYVVSVVSNMSYSLFTG